MMINPADDLKYTNGITVSALKAALKAAGIKKMSAEIDGIIAGTPSAVTEAKISKKESSSPSNLS